MGTKATDITCNYDFFANQLALNNLNEKVLHEQISSVCKHETQYTIAGFDELSMITNVTDRIKFYLDVVSSKLSCFDDIQQTFTDVLNTIKLAGRPTDIYIQDGSFLTQTALDGTSVQKAWRQLTSFWDTASQNFIPYSVESYNLSDFSDVADVAKHLVNDLSAFSSCTYSHSIVSPNIPGQLIYLSDFLTEIYSFARVLEQIKQFQLAVKLKSTNIKTEVKAETQQPSTFVCDVKHSGTTAAYIVQGPYQTIARPIAETIIYLIQTNTNFYKNKILDFTGLVKLSDARANMLQSFSLNDEGSNGILSYTNFIKETDFSVTDCLSKFEQQFGIAVGKVMSRKSLLKFIDLIFFTWATNIKKLYYNCSICHLNCHENSIEFDVHPYIHGNLYHEWSSSNSINGRTNPKQWSIPNENITHFSYSPPRKADNPPTDKIAKVSICVAVHRTVESPTTCKDDEISISVIRIYNSQVQDTYETTADKVLANKTTEEEHILGTYYGGEDLLIRTVCTSTNSKANYYTMCIYPKVKWLK